MFKYGILFSAIFIALCAAFFSISGIGTLFIGAPIAAMIMAGSLELGKLAAVSFVYRYWTDINKAFKTYFLGAAIALVLITSVGIYGYLLSAYSTSAASYSIAQSELQSIDISKQSIESQIEQRNNRLTSLQTLRNQQENRLDQLVGRSGLATQQSMIRQSDAEIQRLQREITNLTNSRDSLQKTVLQKQAELGSNSKIATFAYVATMFNVPLDTIVKWFVLIIVLVFDPLSVSLLIAYNIIQNKEKRDKLVPEANPLPKEEHQDDVETKVENKLNGDGEWIDVEDLKKNKNIPDYMSPSYDWSNPSPEAIAWKRNGVQVT